LSDDVVLDSGSTVNNWLILEKLDARSFFCRCIKCNTERRVYKSQLTDKRIDPVKAVCNNCSDLKVGSSYITNRGFKYKIKSYINYTKVLIKFEPDALCPQGYERYTTKHSIKSGVIDYPFERSTAGVGYCGYLRGTFKADIHIVHVWNKMLQRCYKTSAKDRSYSDCVVCEEWHNLKNFHDWYKGQENSGYYQKGFQLDKDILNPKAKEYSPENCRLVPEAINSFTNNNSDSRKTNLPSGVSWKAKNNKYQVAIKSGYKSNKYLCLVSCPKEGYEIYKAEKVKSGIKLAEEWAGLVAPEIIDILRNYKCPDWDWDNNCYM
tara:strand:- start:43838 stop:44800 length:963 start_codon:yes stop_codon:yes gene_type:complete